MFLFSTFQTFLSIVIPPLLLQKQPSSSDCMYLPSSAFSTNATQMRFKKALQYELNQFEEYYNSLQTIRSPAELLLTSLSALSDCCIASFQLLFLFSLLEPSLLLSLQLDTVFHTAFPPIPTLTHSSKHSSEITKSSIKESMLGILESMYLLIDGLPEEMVSSKETLSRLSGQWSHLQSLVQVKEQKREEKPIVPVHRLPPIEVKREPDEETGVCYVYQGRGTERAETTHQPSNLPQRPPSALMHELKSVLAASKQEVKIVVGEDIDLPSVPTQPQQPSRPQKSFFSFLVKDSFV